MFSVLNLSWTLSAVTSLLNRPAITRPTGVPAESSHFKTSASACWTTPRMDGGGSATGESPEDTSGCDVAAPPFMETVRRYGAPAAKDSCGDVLALTPSNT